MWTLTKIQSGRPRTWIPCETHVLDAARIRRIVGGQRAGLDADADAAARREGERPFDEQDAVVHDVADAGGDTGLVSARPLRVPGRPVDLVHDPRLRLVRRGGEREIRIAAGLEQDLQLGIDAAVATVMPRVRKAPVAVDERVARSSVGIARQMAVARIRLEVGADVAPQSGRRVAVVMKVQFHFAEPGARELRELVENDRVVLLARKEEGVPRRTPVSVAEVARKRGVVLRPARDTAASLLQRRPVPERFEVVAQREQDVACTGACRRHEPPRQVARVTAKPTVQVLLAGGGGQHAGSPHTSSNATPRTVAGWISSIARAMALRREARARAAMTTPSASSVAMYASAASSTAAASITM